MTFKLKIYDPETEEMKVDESSEVFEDIKSAIKAAMKKQKEEDIKRIQVVDEEEKIIFDHLEEKEDIKSEEEAEKEIIEPESETSEEETVEVEEPEVEVEPVELAEPSVEQEKIGVSSLFTSAITDEWATVEKYNSIISTLIEQKQPEEVIEIVKDIVDDTLIRIGFLEKALLKISPELKTAMDDIPAVKIDSDIEEN